MSRQNKLRQWLRQWDAGQISFTDSSFDLPHAQRPVPPEDREAISSLMPLLKRVAA